jgi:hypothetical protein
MAFRSKLARYNTVNCEQVMPVPVIPICAVSCCLPQPFCQAVPPSPDYVPIVPEPCQPPASEVNNAPPEQKYYLLEIPTYCPTLPVPCTGTILTNTTGSVPSGYLLCNGAEISRTTYDVLFSVIGKYYGEGDGSKTFNLPNLSPEKPGYCYTYIIKT